jgi:hypothetical protein
MPRFRKGSLGRRIYRDSAVVSTWGTEPAMEVVPWGYITDFLVGWWAGGPGRGSETGRAG